METFHAFRAGLSRIGPKWCCEHKSNFEICETDPTGAGKVIFNSSRPCLTVNVRKSRHPIEWSGEQKCADGAVFEINAEEIHLHIVELKATITSKSWDHIKRQFMGMLVNATAMAAVVGLPGFTSVKAYVAYSSDKLSPSSNPSPITFKLALGTGKPLASGADWTKGEIVLEPAGRVPVTKLVRDASGNAVHSLS